MRRLTLLLALAMAACSPESEQNDESVLLDSAKQPIEKAQGVEDALLDAQEHRDKAIEDAED